jgi:hypothetical protein
MSKSVQRLNILFMISRSPQETHFPRKNFPQDHARNEERRPPSKGQTVEWRNKREGQKGNRPLKNQTITNRQTMKTKSRFLPPKTRKVGHHPYIYLPVSMTK